MIETRIPVIQVTPEMRKVADEQWHKNLDAYKGQAGEVYLPLKKKLDSLLATRDNAQTTPEEKKTAETEIDDLVSILAILDLDVGILNRQTVKQASVNMSRMDPSNKSKFTDIILSQVLHDISLGEILKTAIDIYTQEAHANTSQGLKRGIAANKLRILVQNALDQDRTSPKVA